MRAKSLTSRLYLLAILHKVSPSETICNSYGIKLFDSVLLRGINKVEFVDKRSLSKKFISLIIRTSVSYFVANDHKLSPR